MATDLNNIYAEISLDQAANVIAAVGNKRTVLVQGEMGSGKSSMLKTIARKFPKHEVCYIDMANMDVGDLMLPAADHATKTTEFYPNKLFGAHTGKPVIIMFDEFGKAARPVQNACLPTILERRIGAHRLHPDSIVFATTNLSAEGVGDVLQPHARNRITIVTSRKPNAEEWVDWGMNNNIDPMVLTWVKDFPMCLQSFRNVGNPKDNGYIFHPKEARESFVTPRSLEAASDIVKQRDHFDHETLMHALMGTIGTKAAADMTAYVGFASEMVPFQTCVRKPTTATVPDNPAILCMMVYNAVGQVDKDTLSPFMTYIQRAKKEMQALFATSLMRVSNKAMVATQNAEFTDWARKNFNMFQHIN